MRKRIFCRVLVPVLLTLQSVTALADDRPPVPDFTKGGRPDKGHDWTLGPTGLRALFQDLVTTCGMG